MKKILGKISKQPGLSPGSLVYTGEKKMDKVKIEVIDYNEAGYKELEVKNIKECLKFKEKSTVSWLNIVGISQADIIKRLGQLYNFHPLVLEDILHVKQRPKMEDYGNYIFIILKMIYYDSQSNEITVEQISLLLGQNYIISFQERVEDVFDLVRDRIKSGKGKIRKMKSDYLAYSLIDAVVDHYFFILEKLGDEIENLEDELMREPTPKTMNKINKFKRELIYLRKSVWPLREVISGLQRSETKLIAKTTGIFLRDVYDHTIQIIDTIETFRDIVSGMLDTYLSSISNRMNEVMKVLTIIATIFIPLTFIAGVYGMNFERMPELHWPFGYLFVWAVMITMGVLMVVYFKRKKWL